MTGFHLLVFIIIVAAFFWVGLRGSRRISSPNSFFHYPKLSSNILSLVAANVTIGSGLVYLITGGSQNGLLMFAIPLATGLGYFLLSFFVSKVIPKDLPSEMNFLKGVDAKIERVSGNKSMFSSLVSLCLIVVFVLFLGFEIFAASGMIAPLIIDTPSSFAKMLVSVAIFVIALIYTMLGGVQGVFRTDKLQLIAILTFLVMIIFALAGNQNGTQHNPDNFNKISMTIIVSVISAFLAAIATQFYSIINWTSVSHLQAVNRSRMLKFTGVLTTIVLALIVTIGVLVSEQTSGEPIAHIMNRFTEMIQGGSFLIQIITVVIIAGLASIVFSTVDSIIIAATMFFYDNVLNRNSYSSSDSTIEVRRIRRIALLCFVASFAALMYFNFQQPNIFYLLLTIASGVIVFAPMLATAGYLSRKDVLIKRLTRTVVMTYVSIFVIAFMAGIIALEWVPSITPWISLSAFFLSLIWSGVLIFRREIF